MRAERLNEAKKVVFEILDQGATPLVRIFKYFLNRTASSGDVATLDELSSKLSNEQKRFVSFDNRYCHASLVAGKAEQYLDKLMADLDAATTPEQVKSVAEVFPRGGAIGFVSGGAELLAKFEKLAEKYAARQINAPMNILWAQYFIDNKIEQAEAVWTKYLTNEPRLMFQRVAQVARERQDIELAQRLIDKLHSAKITDGALGIAYSCLVDVLAAKEKFAEGLKTVEQATQHVGIEYINRTALFRLKDGLEKSGQKFPFTIPDKVKRAPEPENSSSSSSSSSDDEVEQLKRKD